MRRIRRMPRRYLGDGIYSGGELITPAQRSPSPYNDSTAVDAPFSTSRSHHHLTDTFPAQSSSERSPPSTTAPPQAMANTRRKRNSANDAEFPPPARRRGRPSRARSPTVSESNTCELDDDHDAHLDVARSCLRPAAFPSL